MTKDHESRLATALATAFGQQVFDATDVVCKATADHDLAAALDTILPNCRYRSGWKRGWFQTRRVRTLLRKMSSYHGPLSAALHGHQHWSFRVRDE
jgi:hypothetical protein